MIRTNKVSIDGQGIFYRYRPGTSDIFISFLHGYPTSSLDYEHIIESIPSEYHVVAHDHLGFGHSDKPLSHNYQLIDQANITAKLYDTLGAQKIHIVAHDYGTSVATEIIARDNQGLNRLKIQSVTLCNGSMLINMAKLRIIQRLLKNRWVGKIVARLSTEAIFQKNMRNLWYDKDLFHTDNMRAHWDLLIANNGKKVLPKITGYIDQRYKFYDRWIGGLKKCQLPIHILWAANDPVAIVEMANKLDEIIPNSTLTIIQECGHYPMLEKGEEWLDSVVEYVRGFDHSKF